MAEHLRKTAVEENMQEFRIKEEPYYLPLKDEVELIKIAYEN